MPYSLLLLALLSLLSETRSSSYFLSLLLPPLRYFVSVAEWSDRSQQTQWWFTEQQNPSLLMQFRSWFHVKDNNLYTNVAVRYCAINICGSWKLPPLNRDFTRSRSGTLHHEAGTGNSYSLVTSEKISAVTIAPGSWKGRNRNAVLQLVVPPFLRSSRARLVRCCNALRSYRFLCIISKHGIFAFWSRFTSRSRSWYAGGVFKRIVILFNCVCVFFYYYYYIPILFSILFYSLISDDSISLVSCYFLFFLL